MSQKAGTNANSKPYGNILANLNIELSGRVAPGTMLQFALSIPLSNDLIVSDVLTIPQSDQVANDTDAPTDQTKQIATPDAPQPAGKLTARGHVECVNESHIQRLIEDQSRLFVLVASEADVPAKPGAKGGPAAKLASDLSAISAAAKALQSAKSADSLPAQHKAVIDASSSFSLLPLLARVHVSGRSITVSDAPGVTASLNISLDGCDTFLPLELSKQLNPLVVDIQTVTDVPLPRVRPEALGDIQAPLRVVLSAFGRCIVSRPIYLSVGSGEQDGEAGHSPNVGGSTLHVTSKSVTASIHPRISVILFAGTQKPDRLRRALLRDRVTVDLYDCLPRDADTTTVRALERLPVRHAQASFNLAPLSTGACVFKSRVLLAEAPVGRDSDDVPLTDAVLGPDTRPPPSQTKTPARKAGKNADTEPVDPPNGVSRALEAVISPAVNVAREHLAHGITDVATSTDRLPILSYASAGTTVQVRASVAHPLWLEPVAADSGLLAALSVVTAGAELDTLLQRVYNANGQALLDARTQMCEAGACRCVLPTHATQAALSSVTAATIARIQEYTALVRQKKLAFPKERDAQLAAQVDPPGLPQPAQDAARAATSGPELAVLTGFLLPTSRTSRAVLYIEGPTELVRATLRLDEGALERSGTALSADLTQRFAASTPLSLWQIDSGAVTDPEELIRYDMIADAVERGDTLQSTVDTGLLPINAEVAELERWSHPAPRVAATASPGRHRTSRRLVLSPLADSDRLRTESHRVDA